jgi:NADPH-dependent 7-cyano-7-deazaguanine reductase QueF
MTGEQAKSSKIPQYQVETEQRERASTEQDVVVALRSPLDESNCLS